MKVSVTLNWYADKLDGEKEKIQILNFKNSMKGE